MICPNCNNQLPDNSVACNMCGMSLAPQQMPQPNMQQIQQTASQAAAQKELKKKQTEGFLVPYLSIGFGVALSLLALIEPIILLMGLAFIGFGVYLLWKRKRNLKELKLISEGASVIRICPKCKSPNIQMSMVQSSSMTFQGKTTISDNINPLRPFTHTNVNHGPVSTINNYSNQCHCLNCGNIFVKPEKIIQ